MKTAQEPTYVRTDNVGETKRATIKASSKIFNFFSEQIYSDKFTAIWRELVANAIDAQKMNGETRPPVVTAPSMLEPYAKVRDFGCSMDHEFMMDKFMAFTDASTKENSNDFIGGFGIGSKAPLSYTEQYSIRCFMDGEVRVYSIFKDEEGCPSIAFLSKDTTTEPDGVEVGFPVRQEDIHKFTATVVRTLQYFDPLPVLEGTDLKLEPIEYDIKGQKWGIRVADMANKRANVIIGGVAYPLNVSEIGYEYQALRTFATMNLDIHLDIGEANIALSREHITHDDELFNKLTEVIKGIEQEFGDQMSKNFSSAKTLWQAKDLLRKMYLDADYQMKNLIKNNAHWAGKKITMGINRPEDFEVLVISYGQFGYNGGLNHMTPTLAVAPKFRSWGESGTFRTDSFDRIIYQDTKDKPSLRIRQAIEQNGGKILFVRDNGEKPISWKKFFEALGNPPKSMVEKLSDYTPLKVARSASGGTRPFKCYVRSDNPRYTQNSYSSELPKGGGLYIVMNNFSAESSSSDISVAKRSDPKNVVWVNLTDFKTSGLEKDPEWYSVEEAIEKVKENYRKEYSDLPEAAAWHTISRENFALTNRLGKLSRLPSFPKRGPLVTLLRLQEKHKDVNSSDHQAVRKDLLGVDTTVQDEKMQKLVKEVKTKHPAIIEWCTDSRLANNCSDDLINRLF